jgi:hypothetical protein
MGAIGLTLLFFIPWDIWFTRTGIWSFSDQYTMGFKILWLPVEEWLFFIAIPFACLFTYTCFRNYFISPFRARTVLVINLVLITLCILLAIVFIEKAYTLYAVIFLMILLLFHLWNKTSWISHFYLAFLVILIPFYLSNGLLTGLDFWNYPLLNSAPGLIKDQIVWYNNNENIGFRIWTVPLEDLFYGMSLILMTITWYEYFLSKRSSIN